MRDLNFRVWDKKLELMVSIGASGIINFTDRIIDYVNIKNLTIEEASFDDCEIMLSTGYKDDNGEMIFEGDIVNVAQISVIDYITPVYWNDEWCSLMVDIPWGRSACFLDSAYFESVKILGNIYQNPELLEKKE